MPNGVLKEITPDDRSYYMASDITALLGISKSKAYDMIRTMRKECIDAGKLTKAYPIGRIPKKYFDEYCMEEKKALRARLEGEKASNDKTIGSCAENVSTVKLESEKITENVLKLSETVKKYQEAKRSAEELHIFADQKNNIPVYTERKKHVEEKLKDLEEQERKKNAEWMRLSAEYIQLRDRLADMPAGKEERLSELERKKSDLEEKTTSMQVRKGVLLQRIEDTKKIREEISQLKSDITHDADASAKYEVFLLLLQRLS